ncbi:MAG: hypothetical protein OHK0041_11700 [Anaerolineales bacterium]
MAEIFIPPRLTGHGRGEDRRLTRLELFYDIVHVAASLFVPVVMVMITSAPRKWQHQWLNVSKFICEAV